MGIAIVETPFQLLCAYELSGRYPADKIRVIVRMSGRGSNDSQLDMMIAELDMNVEKIYFPSGFSLFWSFRLMIFLLRLLAGSRCKVIYQGSYYSRFQTLVSNVLRPKEKWYLDDGFASLMMKRWPEEKTLDFNLYTIFDFSSGAFGRVEFNGFSCLRRRVTTSEPSGSYFIGQPLVERGYLAEEIYLQIIRDAINKVGSFVYYIPHRVENASLLNEISRIEGCVVLDLNSCVEWYFVKNRIYPKYVFGINSTALVSLSLIYSDADVVSYKVGFKGYRDQGHIELIYSYLSEMKRVDVDLTYFDGSQS